MKEGGREEEVWRSRRLCTADMQVSPHISLDELGQVCVPYVIHMRPLEERDTMLICLQARRRREGGKEGGREGRREGRREREGGEGKRGYQSSPG